MIKNNIRPYEISLWTLQDSFITVLKPINLYNKGHFETPKMTIKDDGTQELSLKIPMYYYEGSERIENPAWYSVKDGSLIVNMRKLKVIFNKGEKDLEEIFEFVINKVTETHTDGQLYCEVEAEGLAFQELGKIGYKISLSQEEFEEEYNEWWDRQNAEEDDKEDVSTLFETATSDPEPISNINYWCDKAFKSSNWTYEIQMDWSCSDGITIGEGERKSYVIYEDEYVDSWIDKDEALMPQSVNGLKEKARIVSTEKSNLYNITQTIAETFGVFCRYEYEYDSNYHIIGRKCVFYNNYLNEKEGRIDINYPFDSSKIERELDSSDIVTKMFVVPIEDETSSSGLLTIADVAANKSREDYILNFDYLYEIGTITEEQYNAISPYERAMYLANVELTSLSSQIAKMETDLVDYKAQLTTATNGQTYDKEQIEQATALMDAIMGEDTVLHKTEDNPYRVTILQNEKGHYVKVTQEGILYTSDSDIGIYYYQEESESSIAKTWKKYEGDYSVDTDEYGNVYQISGITIPEDAYSNVLYLTFNYRPRLQYENIIKTFASQLAIDEASAREAENKIAEIEDKLKTLQGRYDEVLVNKEANIADFENMMGPAIKEGSWQAEDPQDFGTNYTAEIRIGDTEKIYNGNLSFLWDDESFDDESSVFYEITNENGLTSPTHYPAIDISECLKDIVNNLDNLSLIFSYTEVSKNEAVNTYSATINSELHFGFLRNGENIIPILYVTKELTDDQIEEMKKNGFLGILTANTDEKGVSLTYEKLFSGELNWIKEWVIKNEETGEENEKYNFVYPRLKIDSLQLNTSEDKFSIYYNNADLKKSYKLEKFYDYSMLIRDESYLITLKNEIVLQDALIEKTLSISYRISNLALSLYLDALEVSKTNAFPQVSYSVDISALNNNFIQQAYKMLGRVVCINDTDLKLSNVQGYISELELNLDDFWEDKITIKNYKTKFEDLFSSIVASTEQMKTNSFSYNLAASAFTSSGSIKENIIQNTINKVDLDYAFCNGKLTIDETNGIWATSDTGVVAIRGGGIFCSTKSDEYDNWIWNTGITPSGINANLITAGQIDTNLIKIYAGDNLRFQLNADGLYAYRQSSAGETETKEYVVHNSEGLFLSQNGINRVEVSWNGLILRDSEGKTVFDADDENGNLAITGKITAADGEIGGWTIKESGLYYVKDIGTNTSIKLAGLQPINPATEDPYDMFWVFSNDGNSYRKHEFRVQSDGTVYANNIIASGFITSSSYVGNTTVEEINSQLKRIDLIPLQGTTFSFNNLNYDNNLVVTPSFLYFKINTNALSTEEELVSKVEIKDDQDQVTDSEECKYEFYYTTDNIITKDTEWYEAPDNYVIYDGDNYLTFKVNSDIMYIGDNSTSPKTSIYLKVQRKGYKKNISEDTTISYDIDTYEAVIQLKSELNGVGKYISEMSPQSYTFVEDKDSGQSYADTTTFSLTLEGFTKDEVLNGFWLIDGEKINPDPQIVGDLEDTEEDDNNTGESAVILSEDEELFVEGNYNETEDDEDQIVGEDLTASTGYEYLIEKVDNKYIIKLVISEQKVKEGSNLKITYKMDSATRSAYCFKNRVGANSIVVAIYSTSGDTLTSGDTITDLTVNIYFGSQLMNGDDNNTYYYVWKKDNVALSTLFVSSIEEKTDSTGATVKETKKDEYEFGNTVFFKQRTIRITAADFGLKAIYSCEVFDNLNEAEDEYYALNEKEDIKS